MIGQIGESNQPFGGNELMAEIGRSRETAQDILSKGSFIRDAHERAHRIDCCGYVAIDEGANDTCQISDEHLFGNRIRWAIKTLRGLTRTPKF